MLKWCEKDCSIRLEGAAHIVISITKDGRTLLEGFVGDRWDSTYMPLTDERLLGQAVPQLLTELRQQLQSVSGSAVTE